MMDLRDLETDSHNVPTMIEEGVDLSVLTSVIRPIADLIEADITWDYKSLQAEIGQVVSKIISTFAPVSRKVRGIP
jgi:hypothetical protein